MKKIQTRCYNSGKISDLPYLVANRNFGEADKEIEELGLTPVNPMLKGMKFSRPWFVHMIADLCLLATCRHIYLQTNWKESKGAQIECRIARFLGIQIWFQDNPGCD